MKIKAALTVAAALVSTGAMTGLASAGVNLGTSANPMTVTSPDYVLANDGNAVYWNGQGHVSFIAKHKNAGWDDTYLVTGYSRGTNTSTRDGQFGYHNAYRLPLPFSSATSVKGGMGWSQTGGVNRPGWDIWLVPTSKTSTETTAKTMEESSDTVEVMLQPGSAASYGSSPWHRAWQGVGSLSNVNLKAQVQRAASHMHVNLSGYSWMSIDAGAEMTRGTFRLNWYSLGIKTSYTARQTKGAWGYYNGVGAYRWATRTATASNWIKENPYSVIRPETVSAARASAAKSASWWAWYYARKAAIVKYNASH